MVLLVLQCFLTFKLFHETTYYNKCKALWIILQKFFDTVLENTPKPAEALSRKKALLSDPALNMVRSQSIPFLSQSSHWTFGGQCCHPGCQLFRERKEHSCQMVSSFLSDM